MNVRACYKKNKWLDGTLAPTWQLKAFSSKTFVSPQPNVSLRSIGRCDMKLLCLTKRQFMKILSIVGSSSKWWHNKQDCTTEVRWSRMASIVQQVPPRRTPLLEIDTRSPGDQHSIALLTLTALTLFSADVLFQTRTPSVRQPGPKVQSSHRLTDQVLFGRNESGLVGESKCTLIFMLSMSWDMFCMARSNSSTGWPAPEYDEAPLVLNVRLKEKRPW